MKNWILYIFLICTISCESDELKNRKSLLSNDDYKEILESIEIPENPEYNIFISINRFINDTTFIISISQTSLKLEGSEQITPFEYKEMDTYFSLNRFNSWVPDSYYKELLVETNECYFNFYELKLINSFLLKEKNCRYDTTDLFNVDDIQ